jgi:hypothetical protein
VWKKDCNTMKTYTTFLASFAVAARNSLVIAQEVGGRTGVSRPLLRRDHVGLEGVLSEVKEEAERSLQVCSKSGGTSCMPSFLCKGQLCYSHLFYDIARTGSVSDAQTAFSFPFYFYHQRTLQGLHGLLWRRLGLQGSSVPKDHSWKRS